MVAVEVVAATANAVRELYSLPLPVESHLLRSAEVVWGLIEGYTRGHGVPAVGWPPADLVSVAHAATARLAYEPKQFKTVTVADGPFAGRQEGGFHGWTLAELTVLNRYRPRAL